MGVGYHANEGAICDDILSPNLSHRLFPRAGNGGTGCRLYPRRSLRRQGSARSASGAGGSRAFAPRLSPRSSSSGVPPVVLGSHGLDWGAVRWQMLGVDRGRVAPGLAFRVAARVNGR